MSDGAIGVREVEEQLERELLAIHVASYGRGARQVRVRLFDDAVVGLLDELELLPNEEFLIDAGNGDAVLDIRTRYQHAIESTFRAAVERATGRRVVSFVSVTKLHPTYALEFFRLAPRTSAELAQPAGD